MDREKHFKEVEGKVEQYLESEIIRIQSLPEGTDILNSRSKTGGDCG